MSCSIDSDEWVQRWRTTLARDLIDSKLVAVEWDTSVEEACELLLSEDILCLAVKSSSESPDSYFGLFDFSDVNAFLVLAATRPASDDLQDPRSLEIIKAARAGRVPVHLVVNLSDKNPMQILPNDASVFSLLEIFARGSHRALIQCPSPSTDFLGIVSDRSLLAWFSIYAQETPSFLQYLSSPLLGLSLPSLDLYSSIVAATSNDTVLDAMKMMSEEGVSSVAVLDDETGSLLSAVSVTDIGKIVVPSQSNQILSTPLNQFISQIKAPDGSTDGVDKSPVYSVVPSSILSYTIQKLLATNAHRLFVTTETPSSPMLSKSPSSLSGIISVVDILSLFAAIAKIEDVDPARMRHRRASSASSSGGSDSRSSSRTGIRRNSSLRSAIPVVRSKT
ncbi:hypothetical protein C8J56DRAFT_915189 [Mycena floridula]|nr:hypothetical protein C8J56DRAFT_915189 [Mycena floridula]